MLLRLDDGAPVFDADMLYDDSVEGHRQSWREYVENELRLRATGFLKSCGNALAFEPDATIDDSIVGKPPYLRRSLKIESPCTLASEPTSNF